MVKIKYMNGIKDQCGIKNQCGTILKLEVVFGNFDLLSFSLWLQIGLC